jgi:hypothetical protein
LFNDPSNAEAQNPGGDPGPLGSTDPTGTTAACVTSVANARLQAANLVFMYDKSGSMGNPADGGDPKVKWIPVGTGLKAFFGDPGSAGMSASLQFFPEGGNLDATCTYPYATPLVPLTPLSDPKAFISAIDGTAPSGGTPTLPALSGAIAYAQKVAQGHSDAKTVVVLVTDGEPGYGVNGTFVAGCTNNDIAHVAQAAKDALAATPSIATYVIGVGSSLTKLDAIAQAGGTNKAFIVDVSDPAKTKGVFQGALNAVRSSTVTCDFSLPAPPSGEELDVDRVNVVVAGASGQSTLTYSADCAGSSGWHYDDRAAPKKVELCPATCDAVRADPSAAIQIAFGCTTHQVTK